MRDLGKLISTMYDEEESDLTLCSVAAFIPVRTWNAIHFFSMILRKGRVLGPHGVTGRDSTESSLWRTSSGRRDY